MINIIHNSVKYLCQINKAHKSSFIEFNGFFGYLAEYKYYVNQTYFDRTPIIRR
jgi:hypothetical protein